MRQDSARRGADLEGWIDRYGDGLLRLCLLRLGDYALAEDAVQETFIRAYRHYDKFEGRSTVKTWLTAIAINVCATLAKKQRRGQSVSLEVLRELPAPLDGGMGDYTVTEAVMKLPPEQREVLLMHELQGMKLREIAEARRVPVATVASRLRRAKDKLRAELGGWYLGEE